jgi:hypothetical protein
MRDAVDSEGNVLRYSLGCVWQRMRDAVVIQGKDFHLDQNV